MGARVLAFHINSVKNCSQTLQILLLWPWIVPATPSKSLRLLLASTAACLAVLGGTALGQTSLESERDSKEAELEEVRHREGVLSTELAAYSEQVDQLAGQVATLRNREAIVAE